MKVAIIQGSSRNDGNTALITEQLITLTGWDLYHLSDYNIQHYNYAHDYSDDDFLPLIKELIDTYEVLVFATPVYWYSMSGTMKVFFDRFTDLLKIEKDWGRQLRTLKMAALCSSNSKQLEDDFWNPFRRTANYLGMDYLGEMHFYNSEAPTTKLERFIGLITKDTAIAGRHPFKVNFLDHVAIRVKDLEISAAWYESVLGLKRYSFKEWGPFPIFLLAGKSGIALFPEKSSAEEATAGVKACTDHFAFQVTHEELQHAMDYYTTRGLLFEHQDHIFFDSVYTKDPDGHIVELTALKPGKEYFYDHPDN